ncbi:Mannosyl-oligosaccharide 1,2-alpha-mannosidase MNS2 [Porphyridium purpureum]|uniref:alpha-1,2-Mannosidase n=1 Tax=Porphyridium purpureum TaxID=35688 RepID=A0A5J4Z6A5_PORPP|nr:Mannosyl-oligosaccharide 1,2-alpha-mannosidase MNS2 [Porphyridium purpureum]|eukprot:POR8908..scf295_1
MAAMGTAYEIRLGNLRKHAKQLWYTCGSRIGHRGRTLVVSALAAALLTVLLTLLNWKWDGVNHTSVTASPSAVLHVGDGALQERAVKQEIVMEHEVLSAQSLAPATIGKGHADVGTGSISGASDSAVAAERGTQWNGASQAEQVALSTRAIPGRLELQPTANGGDRERTFKQMMPETEDQRQIRAMVRFAWTAYVEKAWGKDLLNPVAKTGSDHQTFGGQAATIVDAIDTLYLVGMFDEFEKARDFILDELVLDKDASVQFFENVIRQLGGLLGAYTVSGDKRFIEKAMDMGFRLLPALEKSHSGWPYQFVNLHSGSVRGDKVVLAEAMLMEFRYLAQISGEKRFAQAANRLLCVARENREVDGLYRSNVAVSAGAMTGEVLFGPNGDSWYEYLLKLWVQTGMTEPLLRDMYMQAANTMIRDHLIPLDENRSYVADTAGYVPNRENGQALPSADELQMEAAAFSSSRRRNAHDSTKNGGRNRPTGHSNTWHHLACFLPGMFSLGYGLERDRGSTEAFLNAHKVAAEKVLHLCSSMYSSTATGLAPWSVAMSDHSFRLNLAYSFAWPEHVESLYIMSRVFWDERETFREEGRRIYTAIEKHYRVETGGYAGLSNVNSPPSGGRGRQIEAQETWVLGETFKYLYLLFSEDRDFMNPLSQVFVLNTEAHPFLVVRENPYPLMC